MILRRAAAWLATPMRRWQRDQFWRRHVARAARLGLSAPLLVLSFDCDTDEDAIACRALLPWLADLGIRCTLAVPGQQLLRNRKHYETLAAAGAEFMNHGAAPHTRWQDDQYVSDTFYDQMSEQAVAEDMRQGQELTTQVTGRPPRGFRAPHFGTFQRPKQLRLVHRLAASLGCDHCSTTTPATAAIAGMAYIEEGVVELPVLGSYRHPLTILDSWTHLTDRRRYALDDRYRVLAEETMQHAARTKMPMLLNWYVDPVHVAGQPAFLEAMTTASRLGLESLTMSQAADRLRSPLETLDGEARPCAA